MRTQCPPRASPAPRHWACHPAPTPTGTGGDEDDEPMPLTTPVGGARPLGNAHSTPCPTAAAPPPARRGHVRTKAMSLPTSPLLMPTTIGGAFHATQLTPLGYPGDDEDDGDADEEDDSLGSPPLASGNGFFAQRPPRTGLGLPMPPPLPPLFSMFAPSAGASVDRDGDGDVDMDCDNEEGDRVSPFAVPPGAGITSSLITPPPSFHHSHQYHPVHTHNAHGWSVHSRVRSADSSAVTTLRASRSTDYLLPLASRRPLPRRAAPGTSTTIATTPGNGHGSRNKTLAAAANHRAGRLVAYFATYKPTVKSSGSAAAARSATIPKSASELDLAGCPKTAAVDLRTPPQRVQRPSGFKRPTVPASASIAGRGGAVANSRAMSMTVEALSRTLADSMSLTGSAHQRSP
ncbi:hypothetical protein H9P43_004275 [Blastocladiella emersonii ATCC 22665]|nr:hypothetical protein H9P43_004275 [Blastocladiella emersonii ATCC 22665]